jgi:hypothetical protein
MYVTYQSIRYISSESIVYVHDKINKIIPILLIDNDTSKTMTLLDLFKNIGKKIKISFENHNENYFVTFYLPLYTIPNMDIELISNNTISNLESLSEIYNDHKNISLVGDFSFVENKSLNIIESKYYLYENIEELFIDE